MSKYGENGNPEPEYFIETRMPENLDQKGSRRLFENNTSEEELEEKRPHKVRNPFEWDNQLVAKLEESDILHGNVFDLEPLPNLEQGRMELKRLKDEGFDDVG